jgi:hypothetical protein
MMLARHGEPIETSWPLAVLRLLWQPKQWLEMGNGGCCAWRVRGPAIITEVHTAMASTARIEARTGIQFLPETAKGPRIEHIEGEGRQGKWHFPSQSSNGDRLDPRTHDRRTLYLKMR